MKVKYKCVRDTLSMKSDKPKYNNLDFVMVNEISRLFLNFEVSDDNKKEYNIDLSERFIQDAPMWQCPINQFKIFKVVKAMNEEEVVKEEYEELFSINNQGVFEIETFKVQYNTLHVYIWPFNSEIWGPIDDYLVSITFKAPT